MKQQHFDGIEIDLMRLKQRNTFGAGIGSSILQAIQKEGLTYEEAYAGLEFAYEALRYSANFAQIQPSHILHLEVQLREERDRIQNEDLE